MIQNRINLGSIAIGSVLLCLGFFCGFRAGSSPTEQVPLSVVKDQAGTAIAIQYARYGSALSTNDYTISILDGYSGSEIATKLVEGIDVKHGNLEGFGILWLTADKLQVQYSDGKNVRLNSSAVTLKTWTGSRKIEVELKELSSAFR